MTGKQKIMNLLYRNRLKSVVVNAFTQSISSTNLYTNGDMETGDPPSSWGASGGTMDGVADERTGGAGVQSIQIARLDNQYPYVFQSITTEAGHWYRFLAWMRNVDATGARIRYNMSAQVAPYMPRANGYAGTDWKQVEIILRAPDTGGAPRYHAWNSTGTQAARFDDVGAFAITASAQITAPNADMQIDIDLTLPEASHIGERIVVCYRLGGALETQDDFWQASIIRNDADDDWDFILESVADTTATERASSLSIGTPTKLRIACNGTEQQCYMYAEDAWTPLHNIVDIDAGLSSNTGINVIYSPNMEPERLTVRPSNPF